MYKYEAEEITGGLSAPGKMPEGSFNLPASACETGQKLAKVPGTPCYKCYADDRGRYRFPNVKAALARRLASLSHPRWVEAMTVLVKGKKHFRWHDSGDLQGVWHLKNIFEVCKQTPSTKHWLPTREVKYPSLMDPAVVPTNLKIIISDHMIDQKSPVKSWPYTSGVTTNGDATCPAPSQGGKCGSCRQCWDRGVARVVYGKH